MFVCKHVFDFVCMQTQTVNILLITMAVIGEIPVCIFVGWSMLWFLFSFLFFLLLVPRKVQADSRARPTGRSGRGGPQHRLPGIGCRHFHHRSQPPRRRGPPCYVPAINVDGIISRLRKYLRDIFHKYEWLSYSTLNRTISPC